MQSSSEKWIGFACWDTKPDAPETNREPLKFVMRMNDFQANLGLCTHSVMRHTRRRMMGFISAISIASKRNRNYVVC